MAKPRSKTTAKVVAYWTVIPCPLKLLSNLNMVQTPHEKTGLARQILADKPCRIRENYPQNSASILMISMLYVTFVVSSPINIVF